MRDPESSSSDTLTSRFWLDYRHWFTGVCVLLISILIWKIQGGETVFPESWISAFPFADKVNEFDKWMRPILQSFPAVRLPRVTHHRAASTD